MSSQEAILIDALINKLHQEIADEMSLDKFFEIFSSEQILKDYDLSYDELEQGNIGNGNDGGIDSIYMFVNGTILQPDYELPDYKKAVDIELHIIQSKNSTTFNESTLQKFNDSAEDIFNLEKKIESFYSVYNTDLINHIKTFRDTYLELISKQPNLTINYFYVSKGTEIHPNVERKVLNLEGTIKRYFPKSIFNFEFITASDLLELSRREKKETFSLSLSESPITTTEGGYICLAGLTSLYKFVINDDGTINKYIFDANVRDYQGSTVVNKEIYKSLEEKSDIDFWWLNNGITIISEKVNLSGKILTIQNPQIVNGCQTSFEVFNYFNNNTSQIKNDTRNIMIRVIETDNDNIRSNVVKSTNSQTAIPLATLRATDIIHRNIEEFLIPYGFFYERRKNYWKNQKKPITNIVTISFLSQIIMAMILRRPEISRAKPSSLVKNDDEYHSIFNEEYSLETYLNAIKLQKKIEHCLSNSELLNKGEGLNIRYFVSLCTVLNRKITVYKTVPNLLRATQEFNEIKLDEITDTEITNNIKIVLQIFRDFGGTDGVAKAKYFTDKLINYFN